MLYVDHYSVIQKSLTALKILRVPLHAASDLFFCLPEPLDPHPLPNQPQFSSHVPFDLDDGKNQILFRFMFCLFAIS